MTDRVISYSFRGNFTNLVAGAAAGGKAVGDLGAKLTALDKNGAKMRSGLTTLGSAGAKAGLVAAAGVGAVVLAAAKFDKAMSSVQAATHETASNMELLRAAAIKAGADTAYSASEAAGAIEELAKAGVSTQDILAGGLSGALNLAAAGSLDVASAAEIAATAMTQFKLGGDQVNHVADLLAAGAGKAQGSVEDMGMALKQGGLVAAQTGLSIDETTGALAEFAANGLIGSDAGTSFKTMLQALTPNSDKARNAMDELGISAYDAQGNFVGMAQFAGQLQTALSGLSVEQQNAALKTIFGSDAVRAASIIFKDGASGVAEWQNKVNDAGYAAETAGQRMDNLAGDFEQFKGSLETMLIGAGEGSQGPLRKLTQGATETVNALGAIPGPAKSVATSLAGITAVTGGGLWFGSKVINGVTEMKGAMQDLGIEASSTREKLAFAATAGAAVALGSQSLIHTINLMDSFQRSGEAADAAVKNYQDLADALGNSNIGKYADDLHINLGRLAEDLLQNGQQGEYASRVIAQLDADSHGFSSFAKAEYANTLGQITSLVPGVGQLGASADQSHDALKDLNAIIANGGDVIGKGAEATAEATQANNNFGVSARKAARAAAEQADELRKSREAATSTAQGFITLGNGLDDAKVSLGQWIHQMAQQADALANFRQNAEKAANKGLRQGLIAALEEAGPAGALRMKQLANATDEQIARANAAWKRGQDEIKRYTNAVGGVPKSHSTDLKLIGVPTALSALARIMQGINNLHDKTVTLKTVYSVVGNVGDALPPRGHAVGGLILGPGGPREDKIPAWLSNGEFVVNAAATARNLPLLHDLNAMHFEAGGPVNLRSSFALAAGTGSRAHGTNHVMPAHYFEEAAA